MDSIFGICDSLIDTSHVKNENIKRMEEDICEYKAILELIGYYHLHNESKEKLESKIIMLRIHILKTYDELLRNEYVNHLRLLIADIEKTVSFKKGKDRYHSIRNIIIYNFRKELYNACNSADYNRLKKNIDNIVSMDPIYDLYYATISALMKEYHPFKKIMIENFIDKVWI